MKKCSVREENRNHDNIGISNKAKKSATTQMIEGAHFTDRRNFRGCKYSFKFKTSALTSFQNFSKSD